MSYEYTHIGDVKFLMPTTNDLAIYNSEDKLQERKSNNTKTKDEGCVDKVFLSGSSVSAASILLQIYLLI